MASAGTSTPRSRWARRTATHSAARARPCARVTTARPSAGSRSAGEDVRGGRASRPHLSPALESATSAHGPTIATEGCMRRAIRLRATGRRSAPTPCLAARRRDGGRRPTEPPRQRLDDDATTDGRGRGTAPPGGSVTRAELPWPRPRSSASPGWPSPGPSDSFGRAPEAFLAHGCPSTSCCSRSPSPWCRPRWSPAPPRPPACWGAALGRRPTCSPWGSWPPWRSGASAPTPPPCLFGARRVGGWSAPPPSSCCASASPPPRPTSGCSARHRSCSSCRVPRPLAHVVPRRRDTATTSGDVSGRAVEAATGWGPAPDRRRGGRRLADGQPARRRGSHRPGCTHRDPGRSTRRGTGTTPR